MFSPALEVILNIAFREAISLSVNFLCWVRSAGVSALVLQ